MKIYNSGEISATTEEVETDIICYGTIVNYGEVINSKMEALGGIHNK